MYTFIYDIETMNVALMQEQMILWATTEEREKIPIHLLHLASSNWQVHFAFDIHQVEFTQGKLFVNYVFV